MEIYNLSEGQVAAVEIIALEPGVTNKKVAKEVGVSENTICNWRKNPEFINSCFERFREISGTRLMSVMDAMFSEAEDGNVPAARLILEHYNKLEKNINISIDSPFERFLKMDNILEGEISSPAEVFQIENIKNSDEDDDRKIKKQEKRLKKTISGAYKDVKRKTSKRERRILRERAETVNLEPLPPGRPKPEKRKAWLKELERREKDLGISQ